MLATYPELFASGAIVAGLPYGCAASIPEAFDRMRGHGLPSERELGRVFAALRTNRGLGPRSRFGMAEPTRRSLTSTWTPSSLNRVACMGWRV